MTESASAPLSRRHLFFDSADLERAARRQGPAGWPGFDEAVLLQPAPATMISADGVHGHSILRFDGTAYTRVTTADTKFACWLVSSNCMAFALGRGTRFRDAAQAWVAAMIDLPIWDVARHGDPRVPHIDLNYGNIAYACAFFLDLCGDSCEPAFRQRLVGKLIEQVQVGDGRFRARPVDQHPYTQNHFYIPFTGYLCMCVALSAHWQEASVRLEEAKDFAGRIIAGLGSDGWYYEGLNYCHYAGIWLVRLAALTESHLGLTVHDAPSLARMHHFLDWTMFPKGRHFFHLGDNSSKKWRFASWPEAEAADADNWNDTWVNNNAQMLYWIGLKSGDARCRAVADRILARGLHVAEGFWGLIWDAPTEASTPSPRHHFTDFGVWASDTTDAAGNTLRILGKCGPPMGHGFQLDASGQPTHRFNAGHVHPDAGSVVAAWNELPVLLGPGYLGRKAGAWQNSLTIDGLGQDGDQRYHVFLPGDCDLARLDGLTLAETGDGIRMDVAAAYRPGQGVTSAIRTLGIASARSFVITDSVALARAGRIEARYRVSDPPRLLDATTCEWSVCGQRMRLECLEASRPVELWVLPGEITTINDDGTPGPLEGGLTCQRGYQILIRTRLPALDVRWQIRVAIL